LLLREELRRNYSPFETPEALPAAGVQMSFTAEQSPAAEAKETERARSRPLSRLAVWTFIVCIYALGVNLRWGIVASLRDYYGDLPYTMESALLFHYAQACARGERIPDLDRRAQHPEGLRVARELSLGKDFAAAIVYKALGRPGSFREFVRRFDATWFCIGVFALFLLVREMRGGELGGLIAAAFYAVSLPAVVRSTGLEFSRENFSLPLIFLHWWLVVRGLRRQRFSFASVPAGVLLAVAAATWDVTQLYIFLVGAFAALTLLFGKGGYGLVREFLPGLACLVIAGLTVPYLVHHRFLLSWGMLLWYSLTAAFISVALFPRCSLRFPRFAFVAVFASLVVIVATRTAYPGTYSHFASLFLAKLRFLNVKPLNPAKLSYEARILWTPALHSATSRFLGKYPIADFKMLFVLAAAPMVLLIRSIWRREATQPEKALLFWLAVFLLLYLLFVRMQVFLVFFVCSLIGLGALYGSRLFRRTGARVSFLAAWSLLVLLGLVAEAYTYSTFEKIYREVDTGSAYAADKVLVDWLQKNAEEDAVVLANFTLEPTIFAYAGRAVVLHPKFESTTMRLKVKEYLEALFSKTEKDFHEFCVKNRVNYFVLHPGVFAGPMNRDWIYCYRYMVDRAEMRPEYAALAMRDNPDRLQYFKKATDVSMKGDPFGFFYRVFRVVSELEIEQAEKHVRNALVSLGGDAAKADADSLQRAERELLRAIDLFPGSLEAHSMLATVYFLEGEHAKASQETQRCKQIIADRGS